MTNGYAEPSTFTVRDGSAILGGWRLRCTNGGCTQPELKSWAPEARSSPI